MLPVHILALALTVACLSGINLYLTAFLAGLAAKMGWLALDPGVVAVLAHPAAMTVALLLYLLEAIVDKVPGVDSLWDTLHTVIRPAGAVILALHIMGDAEPAYQVLPGVLAGMAGLTTHLAKTSARLLINNNPGPLLNILASIGEDLLVAGIFMLTIQRPLAGLTVCLTLILGLWLLFPHLFRVARASLFLMWKKVRLPAGVMAGRVKLSAKVSAEQDMLMHGQLPGPCTVQWAVRSITGRVRHFPGLSPNMFGVLLSVKEHPGTLVFIGRRWFRLRPGTVPLTDCEVQHESGFLSEDLVIYSKAEKQMIVFRFTRAEEALAARLEGELLSKGKGANSAPEAGPSPVLMEMESLLQPEEIVLPPLIVESLRTAPGPPPAAPEASSPHHEPIPAFPASHSAPAPFPPADHPEPAAADVPPIPAMQEEHLERPLDKSESIGERVEGPL